MTTAAKPITLIDLPAAAALLGIPQGTVRNHALILPSRKVGRRRLFIQEDLQQGIRDCPPHVNVFEYFAKSEAQKRWRLVS